jgi:hypothetical protein
LFDGTFQDIVIGLVTTIIGAGIGWSWERAKSSLRLRRTAGFFGVLPDDPCRLVMGQYRELPATSHRDMAALVEVMGIVQPLRPEVIVTLGDSTLEPVGDVTEFCIGGPDSNPRTTAHLHQVLTGVTARSYRDQNHSLEISTQTNTYRYSAGKDEYVILSKILASLNAKPLFLICGQTAIANQGALFYLRNHEKELRRKFHKEQFCLVLKLVSPSRYGYKMVELVEDVTRTAFPISSFST